jgi:hypothetical protein
MESWQKIDDEHAHCAECSAVYRIAQLNDGLCDDCVPEKQKKAEKILTRAAEKTTGRAMKASAQLLASIKDQGKTGKSMPVVMDSFIKALGGEAAFGERFATEFKKAHGEGLSAAEMETWEYSPHTVHKWYELANRSLLATDTGKDLDIGSLEESELESIVASIGRKAVLEDRDIRRLALMNAIESDAEFRKYAFESILKADPQLETEWLASHGVRTIAAKNFEPVANKDIEDDYNPESEEYTN